MVELLSIQANQWLSGRELAGVLAGYALGCFTSGYYVVRWRTKQDIRTMGSGNIGAKNVGRVLGTPGFVITFLLDFAKGLLALVGATTAGFRPWAVVGVMLAVIAGHNWPLQLGFQGGKGISTSLGALLLYNYAVVIGLIGVFLVAFSLCRRFTVSGLIAYALAPLVAWALQLDFVGVTGITLVAVMVLAAHRQNLLEEVVRLRPLVKQ